MYQKTRFRLVKSNSPELEVDGSARPGTKSLGYGSESITQFRFIYFNQVYMSDMFAIYLYH